MDRRIEPCLQAGVHFRAGGHQAPVRPKAMFMETVDAVGRTVPGFGYSLGGRRTADHLRGERETGCRALPRPAPRATGAAYWAWPSCRSGSPASPFHAAVRLLRTGRMATSMPRGSGRCNSPGSSPIRAVWQTAAAGMGGLPNGNRGIAASVAGTVRASRR